MTKTLAVLTGIVLAGAAGAQTIDTSGMHAAPLPSVSATGTAPAHNLQHALATKMTRAVAYRDAEGRLAATCEVEANPAGVAAERVRKSDRARKE